MPNFQVPKWVKKHLHAYASLEEVPEAVFAAISDRFAKLKTEDPVVSVVIIAYNEELNILRSISSLSMMQSSVPFEVIVVDNNSKDRTSEVVKRCGLTPVFQPKQGVGWARQAGTDAARGEFHLCGDADTIYPPTYVDAMLKVLKGADVTGAFGQLSFLPEADKARWKLSLYEGLKDLVMYLRSINRPELSAGGASLGFPTALAREIGWRTDIKRGEDGMMAFALKKRGKLKLVTSAKARIWTDARTLQNDGSFFQIIGKRLKREFKRVGEYFTSQKGDYKDKKENKI